MKNVYVKRLNYDFDDHKGLFEAIVFFKLFGKWSALSITNVLAGQCRTFGFYYYSKLNPIGFDFHKYHINLLLWKSLDPIKTWGEKG